MTAPTPGHRFLPAGMLWLAVGSWRVDPAQSHVSFAAQAASRPVLGRVPLTGRVLIDSRWVTGQRIPALGRRIVMTCSLSLEPDM